MGEMAVDAPNFPIFSHSKILHVVSLQLLSDKILTKSISIAL